MSIDPEILNLRTRQAVAESIDVDEVEEWLINTENEYIYQNKQHKIECFEDALNYFKANEMYEKCAIVMDVINGLKDE